MFSFQMHLIFRNFLQEGNIEVRFIYKIFRWKWSMISIVPLDDPIVPLEDPIVPLEIPSIPMEIPITPLEVSITPLEISITPIKIPM